MQSLVAVEVYLSNIPSVLYWFSTVVHELFISLGQGAVVHQGGISVIVKPMNAFLENKSRVCCASNTDCCLQ